MKKIKKYNNFLKENVNKLSHKTEVLNELLNNLEHECTISLKNYDAYCIFNFHFHERDDDNLNSDNLALSDYGYLEDYIENFLKEDCKIPFTSDIKIDKKTYWYLCTIMYNNFIIDNLNYLTELYFCEKATLIELRLNRWDFIHIVLMDIKHNIFIKNLDDLEGFCKSYIVYTNMINNIYFIELLKLINNKELLDEYEVIKNAKNFDLI